MYLVEDKRMSNFADSIPEGMDSWPAEDIHISKFVSSNFDQIDRFLLENRHKSNLMSSKIYFKGR